MCVDKEAKWEGGLKKACPQGHRKNAVLPWEVGNNTIFTKKKVSILSELVWMLNTCAADSSYAQHYKKLLRVGDKVPIGIFVLHGCSRPHWCQFVSGGCLFVS